MALPHCPNGSKIGAHSQLCTKTTSQTELGTQQLFSFATTTTWQNVKASVTQKNSKMFRPPGLNQVATTNIVKMQYRLQVFGLKTWSRCRVSFVACPARLPNALQVVEMVWHWLVPSRTEGMKEEGIKHNKFSSSTDCSPCFNIGADPSSETVRKRISLKP